MAADTLPAGSGLVRVSGGGATFTVPAACQKLILPTNSQILLPMFNEYVLNSNRLTILESPFGGLKGSGAADYAPGTVYINSGDGVYLTDINGNNSTKTLTSGKMREVNSLTVDTSAKTITEEFIIENTNTNNASYPICNCDATNYWSSSKGTIVLDTNNKQEGSGCISNTATTATDVGSAYNPIGTWDLSAYDFLTLWIKGVSSKIIQVIIKTDDSNYGFWNTTANGNWQRLVLPLKKPTGKVGSLNLSSVDFLIVYTLSADIGNVCLIDDINADIGKACYLEIDTPDFLADSSLQIYCHNGTSYNLCGTYKLDSNYSAVSTTSANWTFADSTKLDDVYPTDPKGRALYPKSSAGLAVAGSDSTQLTYSNNKGTSKRIGFKVLLPPSDSGRTKFSSIRLKTIFSYNSNQNGKYASTYEFEDSLNASYGLQNMAAPWFALVDSSGRVEYYIFTDRPAGLTFRRDDSGAVYEIVINPGNSQVFRGVSWLPDQTTDTDADLIPDSVKNLLMPALSGWAFNG